MLASSPTAPAEDEPGGGSSVLARLALVPDPRSRQSRRHEIGYVLAVTVAATLACGHDSVSAIADWAADAPASLLAELGGRADPWTGVVSAPSRPTLGRVLARVDATQLQAIASERALAQMRACRPEAETEAQTAAETAADDPANTGDEVVDPAASRLPAVAIGGKSVRGAAAGGSVRPHLLAVASHDGIVLTQRQIPDKGSEISEVEPLIADLDLTGHVITLDALHTQRATAEHLVTVTGAHYVMTVKLNQPTLLAACQAALSGPAGDFADEDTTIGRGHGRTEQRTTRTTPVTEESGIDFPHAAQAVRSSATPVASTASAPPKRSPGASPASPPAKPTPPISATTCADTGPSSRPTGSVT